MFGRALRVVGGIILVLVGVVWLLQGLNVLPGSSMTGSAFWGIVGALALAAGSVLLYSTIQPRKP